MKSVVGNEQGSGGIGVLGLLGIVFVTLKLLGIIQWSWLWVTAPFWGGIVLIIIIMAVAFFIGFVSSR